MDGWITIGTKLDTKDLEKELRNASRELKKFEQEEEKLLAKKAKLEIQLEGLEEGKAKIRSATDEMLKQADTSEQVNNILALENIELDNLTQKYSKQTSELEEINQKIQENANNQGLVATRVEETNRKLQNNKGVSNMSQGISNVADQTKNLIRQVGRWALAVFSVRSAYLFVRQASSTLAQYDKQYAANLEYIRFVLAQMIAPILYTVVNLAFKLLSYINMIANAWFGVNLFANASTKAFEKANKSLGGSVSKAKELNKQLTGFDEMNVLQDNGDVASGGGGGGITMPEFDVSSLQGEVPSWLQWIMDNGYIIVSILLGISSAIIAIKLGLGGIVAIGLGVIVAGILLLMKDLVELIVDPSWEKFGDVLIDIGIILAGLALIIGGIPLIVASAVALILGLVIKYWDEIWAVLEPIVMWIYNKIILPVWELIKILWDNIVSSVKTTISIIGGVFTAIIGLITNPFKVAAETISGIFNGIKTFFSGFVQVIKSLFNGDIKGVFNGFKTMFKGIMDSLWSIAKAPLNLIIGGINSLIKGANKIKLDVPDWVPGIGGKVFGFNIPQIPKLATGGIVNLPGRGVYSNGTIRGEAGAEGVLPLTDSQTMERLGEAIGRYITINANITNTMNGRVISRQLQQIMANQDFAYNS